MPATLSFDEVLAAAAALPPEQQRRLAALLADDDGPVPPLRERLAQAERELAAGLGREIDPAGFAAELLR